MREERAAAFMSKLLGMLPEQCRRPRKPHKDDNNDKKQLEVITTPIVPNWTPPSSKTVINLDSVSRRSMSPLERAIGGKSQLAALEHGNSCAQARAIHG
jgi:hypothetical protein